MSDDDLDGGLDFDLAGFQQLLEPHWIPHRDCQTLCWSISDNDEDGIVLEASPPMQEIYGGPHDGESHEVPFDFQLQEFLQEPGLAVQAFGASSKTPSIFIRGTFQGSPFQFTLHLQAQSHDIVEVYNTFNRTSTPGEDRSHS